MIRWLPLEQSSSGQRRSAPRRSDQEHALHLPISSEQEAPFIQWPPGSVEGTQRGVLDHSPGERPPQSRGSFGALFPRLGPSPVRPQAPRWMCPFGQASHQWSGATPGLVQLACLTRSLYLISLYTLEHCGMKPMKYMYNPSLPPVHEIPEKLTLAVADPNPPTQIPHCLASLFGIKVGWILSAFSCPPITLLTEASVLYGFCPRGFDYPQHRPCGGLPVFDCGKIGRSHYLINPLSCTSSLPFTGESRL